MTGAVLRPGNISELIPPDAWQGRPVLSVATSSEGALWVGTEGGIFRYDGQRFQGYGMAAGLTDLIVTLEIEPTRFVTKMRAG